MSEHHHHGHNHHHHHGPSDFSNLNKAFYIGIGLNLLFVVIEAVYGFINNSLSLLSDAGHNLSDVASLALSLFAFKLLKRKPSSKYTYGYRRATILASLANAVLLLAAVGFIIYEAVLRLFHPEPLHGATVAVVALIGIFINGITAWLFMKDQKKDLNVRGAYLHMVADALVSAGVVVAGVLIIYTQWYWLDAALGIIIGIVILISTWSLLTQSLKLSMDGVPADVDIEKITSEILKINGVRDFTHIHIWALSTTENALTGHIKVDENLTSKEILEIKEKVRHELEHFNIHHSTLEIYFDVERSCL